MMDLCRRHKEPILYCVYGFLTFLIDVGIFFILGKLMDLSSSSLLLHMCSIFSTVIAITFAYVTNRKFVFKSDVKRFKGIIKELTAFFSARIFTMVFAEVFLEIFVIHIGYDDKLMKLIANIVVIVSNYFFSKFYIFKKK